jgi:hypothetical protein
MIAVDLASAARQEANRLREARALAAGARPNVADGPLAWICRRRRLRRTLRRRVLLLYRAAYADRRGRLVHSTLVAVTVALRNDRINVRAVDWSCAPWKGGVDDGCQTWRESVQRVSIRFASTRLSRERAIAATHTSPGPSFQPGLFDRRTHRAHTMRQQDAAELSTRLATRMAAVEAAAALTLRAHELLLVLIPSDAARM